jgi:hypothetical protein
MSVGFVPSDPMACKLQFRTIVQIGAGEDFSMLFLDFYDAVCSSIPACPGIFEADRNVV